MAFRVNISPPQVHQSISKPPTARTMTSPAAAIVPLMPLHPIPVGCKALLGAESPVRFTVRALRKLGDALWEYDITYDADPTDAIHTIRSGKNDGISPLTNSSESTLTKVRFLMDKMVYKVGDAVRFWDFEWVTGVVIRVMKGYNDDPDRHYRYRVKVGKADDDFFTIYSDIEHLAPVNYNITIPEWLKGWTERHNIYYSHRDPMSVPLSDGIQYHYKVNVSISCCFFVLFLFGSLTYGCCCCAARDWPHLPAGFPRPRR